MNQNTKTSNFLNTIDKYAQRQKAQIEEEVEQIRKKKIEQATEEGLQDAYKLIQNEISQKKIELLTEYAQKEQKARVELFSLRRKIIFDIETAVKERITAFTQTERYREKLLEYSEELDAFFGGAASVVYLSSKDMNMRSEIEGIIRNSSVQEDSSIQLGGLKGYCKEKRIIADNTYEAKLNDAMKHFIEKSALEVV